MKRQIILFCMECTADSEMEKVLQQQEFSPGGPLERTYPLLIPKNFGG